VYFNGEQKLLKALENLESGTVNDFTRILPVFTYGDEAAAKGISGQMDEVLKKASLSIQNHTVGKYTDDSYLLMGKAHFIKRDYFAAIESFQYINSRYKDKGLRPISTVWIAKCYSGLKKEEEAEAVVSLLISEFGPKSSKGKEVKPSIKERLFPSHPDEFYREMYATAADIAIKQQKYNTATINLQRALNYTSRKPERIRYTYILGQLSLINDSIKQANAYFKDILSSNAPYTFEFNASINLAKAFDKNDKSAVRKVRKSLKRMLKDEKNDGMYDQIWYELGNLEQKTGNLNEAIKDYHMAAATSTKNPNQKALAYLELANIYFSLPDYRLAQEFFDSTAESMSKDYRDYQKIKIKQEVLNQLINNLIVVETEDSLQSLAKLSQPELEKKIDSWIAEKKKYEINKAKDAQRQKALAKQAEANALANPSGGNNNLNLFNNEAGLWYFYNPSLMTAGAADFFSMKRWGRRANTDFWRISSKEKQEESEENTAKADSIAANEKAGAKQDADASALPDISDDRKAWIKDVPFSEDALDKSNSRMLDALFNIGVLYDEKLLDYKESLKDFELLEERFPANAYEPEVLYRMYKMYTVRKDTSHAKFCKANLIARYPESPYALILQNKHLKSAETDANKEVVEHYERTYEEYLKANYQNVKLMKMEADKQFPGNSLKPKYEFLYALAVGKTDSLSKFKKELELIVTDYPNLDVGERARSILSYIKKRETVLTKDSTQQVNKAEPDFVIETSGPQYVIFATKEEKYDNNELLSGFNRYNEEFSSMDNLKVNNFLSPEGYQLVMIRDFSEIKKAQDYLKSLAALDFIKSQIQFTGKYMIFVISPANFKKMLKDQKLESYAKLWQEFNNKNNQKQ